MCQGELHLLAGLPGVARPRHWSKSSSGQFTINFRQLALAFDTRPTATRELKLAASDRRLSVNVIQQVPAGEVTVVVAALKRAAVAAWCDDVRHSSLVSALPRANKPEAPGPRLERDVSRARRTLPA